MRITMKNKKARFIGCCLTAGLIIVSILGAASCSSVSLAVPAASTPLLSSIAVTPDFADHFIPGSTHQFTATATYSNGIKLDISGGVKWISSDPTIATIASSGFATGAAEGVTGITAFRLGITSPAVSLRVWAPAPILSSITLTPASLSQLAVGSFHQITATAVCSDGSTVDITGGVKWTSSDPAVAVISSSGAAECIGEGSSDITASIQGISSPPMTLSVWVPAPTLTSIIVTPVYPMERFAVGSLHQFTASGVYSDGTIKDITPQVTWTSTDTAVASISPTGLADCITGGTTEVSASMAELTSTPVAFTVWAPTA